MSPSRKPSRIRGDPASLLLVPHPRPGAPGQGGRCGGRGFQRLSGKWKNGTRKSLKALAALILRPRVGGWHSWSAQTAQAAASCYTHKPVFFDPVILRARIHPGLFTALPRVNGAGKLLAPGAWQTALPRALHEAAFRKMRNGRFFFEPTGEALLSQKATERPLCFR